MKGVLNSALILVLVGFVSCKPVDKNTFSHEYFNFEMQLPADWNVQTEKELNRISRTANGAFDDSESITETTADISGFAKINILAAFQYEIGHDIAFNPSITAMADNLKNTPSIQNANDYLIRQKEMLGRYEVLNYSCSEPVSASETIKSQDFYTMKTEVKVDNSNIKQEYYTAVVKQFALTFIISYTTDTERDTLLESLKSIHFTK